MMLQSHFGSIFYLSRTASEKLTGCSRSHGAGNTYLALATHIGTTDRGIVLHDVTPQSGSSQGTQDAVFAHVVCRMHVIEHGRKHAAGTTGRCRNDGSARSILFAHRQGIGVNQAAALQGSPIALCLDMIGGSLALKLQRTRQHTLVVETVADRLLHGFPYLAQIIPNVLILAFLYVFPEGTAVLVAPFLDISHGMKVVDIFCAQFLVALGAIRKGTAADAVHRPLVDDVAIQVLAHKLHSVRMERQEDLRLPDDMNNMLLEHFLDSHIGHVTLAGSSQGTIQCNFVGRSISTTLQEELSCALRSHRMTARWSLANSV